MQPAFDDVIRALEQEFDLGTPHSKILRALNASPKMTADEICAATSLPKGRIYDYLNYLVDSGLICKGTETPAAYFMGNYADRLTTFVRKQYEGVLRKEQRLNQLLEGNTSSQVETFNSRILFNLEVMSLLSRKQKVKVILRYDVAPYFFFMPSRERFVSLHSRVTRGRPVLTREEERNAMMLFDAYKEAFESGKEITYIMGEEALEYHAKLLAGINRVGVKQEFKRLKQQLEEYPKVRILVTKEHSPMNTHVSSPEVLMAVVYGDAWTGIRIRSREAAKVYEYMFDEMAGKAKPLERALGKYIS